MPGGYHIRIDPYGCRCENVNPKIVQEVLGHATISQTMDTYSHVLPDMQDGAVAAMESTIS
jgi:integrase